MIAPALGFIATFSLSNSAELKEIFLEYQNFTGLDIETTIVNKFSGGIKESLLLIGWYS